MVMRFLTVTELKQRATQIISEIESSREEVVITKNGKPVALIQAISEKAFVLKHKEEIKGHDKVRESRGKVSKEDKA
jgi:prevent-host-death family protein